MRIGDILYIYTNIGTQCSICVKRDSKPKLLKLVITHDLCVAFWSALDLFASPDLSCVSHGRAEAAQFC